LQNLQQLTAPPEDDEPEVVTGGPSPLDKLYASEDFRREFRREYAKDVARLKRTIHNAADIPKI
jgi:hypothetical protein